MELNFNFEKIIGKIKPMHAVGQPPVELGNNGVEDDMFHYLTEANIPILACMIRVGAMRAMFL